jgi:DNA-binding MarR family transcriptional regulator
MDCSIVRVTDVNPVDPADRVRRSVIFRLGVVGTFAANRFSAELERVDLKLKHVGMMLALKHGVAASQLELAHTLGVAPSLVVTLADHLEQRGAIQRVRDPEDRRRHILTLTAAGEDLLARCGALALGVDGEIVDNLSAAERTALDKLLDRLFERLVLFPPAGPGD